MGMDLYALNPKAPHAAGCDSLHYNWTGWSELCRLLDNDGIDLREFAGSNDGQIISDETCIKVANALEKMIPALSQEYQEWLDGHAFFWRNCGGCAQW